MGAIAWAIRGSNGWGGMDGTIVPGMMWGILWFYMCWQKGLACHGVTLWLGLGIALGGELGYGQYVSWIRGMFNVGYEVIHVSPGLGWLWFFLCGIGWGAPGGVLLGWALSSRNSVLMWVGRLVVPVITGWLGWQLVQWQPGLFFPNHDLGIYGEVLGRNLDRTVYTNTQNFMVAAWFVGVVGVAAVRRDKVTAVMCAIVGVGFGPGFALAAIWCLGYEYAPTYIDWWKVWELQSGFNSGLLYAGALYWCVRRVDRADGEALDGAGLDISMDADRGVWCVRNLFATLAAFLLVLVLYLEGSWETSLGMGLLFVIFMVWLTVQVAQGLDLELASERRGQLSLIYCVFLFLFVTLRGGSSTLGLVLELYPAESVEQYSWPYRLTVLFVILVSGVVVWTVYQMVRTLKPSAKPGPEIVAGKLADRMVDMMTFVMVIGAVSIWPSEIGILYAVLLGTALWVFNRMNRRLDEIDMSGT